jgi:hypothetical protein
MEARKIAVLAGLLAVALLALFPPYERVYRNEVNLRVYAGHAPVFAPPPPLNPLGGKPHNGVQFPSVEIDFGRLALESVAVLAVIGVVLLAAPMWAGLVTARRRRPGGFPVVGSLPTSPAAPASARS